MTSDFTLEITYRTSIYAPPQHSVTLRSSLNGWDNDIPMTATQENYETVWTWAISHDDSEGPIIFEFKLYLDDAHWMGGCNQKAEADRDSTMAFDDSNVSWEM